MQRKVSWIVPNSSIRRSISSASTSPKYGGTYESNLRPLGVRWMQMEKIDILWLNNSVHYAAWFLCDWCEDRKRWQTFRFFTNRTIEWTDLNSETFCSSWKTLLSSRYFVLDETDKYLNGWRHLLDYENAFIPDFMILFFKWSELNCLSYGKSKGTEVRYAVGWITTGVYL